MNVSVQREEDEHTHREGPRSLYNEKSRPTTSKFKPITTYNLSYRAKLSLHKYIRTAQ